MGNTLVWEKGRQLKQYGANTYKYNNEGIRIRKQTSTEIHEYILDGTNIVKEVVTDTANCPKYVNEYLYDLDGTVCGLKHNDTAYYFYKNLQGDVIAITDDTGATVARYTYDAWGKVLTVTDANGTAITDTNHIAHINPFRYRSYYYDTETKLYYLQSRYYNSEVGRFINADSKLGVNLGIESYALYCYCGNAPVSRIDVYGCAWWGVLVKVVVAVVAVVALAHIVNAAFSLSQADYNKSHDVDSIVSDQNDVDMKLGFQTFAAMGCGAAATHNAIILAGGSSSLANVVEFMQAHDLTLGFAGVYFTNIHLYLKKKGYSNKIYLWKLKNKIDKKIKKCANKIAILAYKHSNGGHYVAIKYNESDKKFYIYNKNREVCSVDSWIKKMSYTPLCLITI